MGSREININLDRVATADTSQKVEVKEYNAVTQLLQPDS